MSRFINIEISHQINYNNMERKLFDIISMNNIAVEIYISNKQDELVKRLKLDIYPTIIRFLLKNKNI